MSKEFLVWKADLGNGTYRNPILCADYPDPDVIHTGEDCFMVASSFCKLAGEPFTVCKGR